MGVHLKNIVYLDPQECNIHTNMVTIDIKDNQKTTTSHNEIYICFYEAEFYSMGSEANMAED